MIELTAQLKASWTIFLGLELAQQKE